MTTSQLTAIEVTISILNDQLHYDLSNNRSIYQNFCIIISQLSEVNKTDNPLYVIAMNDNQIYLKELPNSSNPLF
jgi:hypothetical protein